MAGSLPEARAAQAGARMGLQVATLPLRAGLTFARWKALVILGLLLLLIIVVFSFLSAVKSAFTGDEMAYPESSGIPQVFWPMYTTAASHFHVNPYALASIHKQESEFSGGATGVASGRNFDGCCAGPMQFNVDDGTWAAFKNSFREIASARPAHYPNDRRELPSCRGVSSNEGCVYDSFDSIAAAAAKLKENGGDADLNSAGTHTAVCRYIGSCSEVDECNEGSPNRYCEVLPRAREWEQMGAQALSTAPTRTLSVDGTFPHTLERVQAVADALDQQTERNQIPYCWGGGHSKAGPTQSTAAPYYCWENNVKVYGSKRIGLDCSGAIRWLLVQSGFPDPGGIGSGSYGSYLEPGPGKHVTMYYGSGHIYAKIDGRLWQTSTTNKSHGPGWTEPGTAGPYLGVGHPKGL